MSRAIFTLLYDPRYLPGTLVLGAQLRKLNPAGISIGVLLGNAERFSEHQLALVSQYFEVVPVTRALASYEHHKLEHVLKRPELSETFNKLWLWSLPYDKILYLDSDTLPVVGSPHGTILDLFALNIGSGTIAASPDSGFPDIFNSGMFVLHPNSNDFDNLLELTTQPSFDGADQGLLNQYFNADPNWVKNGSNPSIGTNWIRLPFLYNVTPSLEYEYLPAYNHFQDQIQLVHFIGKNKPWNSRPISGTVQVTNHIAWWNVWDSEFSGPISEVVFQQFSTYVPKEEPQAAPEEIVEDTTQNEVIEPQVEQFEEPSSKDFQTYLLDPQNYSVFPEASAQTQDSLWDATKEPPPPTTANEDAEARAAQLESGIRFVNSWGESHSDSHPQEESHQHHEESHDHQHTQPDQQAASHDIDHLELKEVLSEVFKANVYEVEAEQAATVGTIETSIVPGISHKVAPERVFDSRMDYFPEHKLRLWGNLVKGDPTSDVFRKEDATEKHMEEEAEKEAEREAEEEEKEEEEEEEESESEEVYEDQQSHVARIFPWEFRSRAVPERVFERIE